MVSSRASSGKNPWVAADDINSIRPRSSKPRRAATRSPSKERKSPSSRVNRSCQKRAIGTSCVSPDCASALVAAAALSSRRSMYASNSLMKEGWASWLASTGVTPSVTGEGTRSRSKACSTSMSGR